MSRLPPSRAKTRSGRLWLLPLMLAPVAGCNGISNLVAPIQPAALVGPLTDAAAQRKSGVWALRRVTMFPEVDLASHIGTAFAVSPTRLATAGHVVVELGQALAAGQSLIAVQEETGAIRHVARMWLHPMLNVSGSDAQRTFSGPDIGLLELDGPVAEWFSRADSAALADVRIGANVGACGYPGAAARMFDGADPATPPRVTCSEGQVSSLRPADADDDLLPGDWNFIQSSLSSAPGMSGSAVVNDRGMVVAVLTGSIVADGRENIPPLSSLSWSVRHLADLLAAVDDGGLADFVVVAPTPPSDEQVVERTIVRLMCSYVESDDGAIWVSPQDAVRDWRPGDVVSASARNTLLNKRTGALVSAIESRYALSTDSPIVAVGERPDRPGISIALADGSRWWTFVAVETIRRWRADSRVLVLRTPGDPDSFVIVNSVECGFGIAVIPDPWPAP